VAVNRAHIVDENLLGFLRRWEGPDVGRADLSEPVRPDSRLTGRQLLELIEAQFQARMLDLEARALKARDEGYYTIASAGHEGNAAVAAAARPTDPAFLHYRSGAFFAARARQLPGQTPIFDVLLSLCASADDPIAGGRHKVFGSAPLWIPPQTSTIASHLPKATGAAFALERARRLGLTLPVPEDSIVLCTFGDASINHAAALAGINSALWAHHQRLPIPLLLVCEDNGLGISVRTPIEWIEQSWSRRSGLAYFRADGLDLAETYEQASQAVQWCRERRAPTLLHLKLVRLLGHAGSDVETSYLDRTHIEANEARDPLLLGCRLALESGVTTRDQLLHLYEEIRNRVEAAGDEAASRPHLESVEEILAPLAPLTPDAVEAEARRADFAEARSKHWGGTLPEDEGRPRHMAVQINRALHDLMLAHPRMLVFGEDVARKGGVYHVTDQLWKRFGSGRVFNTLLDETSILGLAIGAAQMGLMPVPEIQYLAYYHNAQDQIRGEAASLQYFSNGQFRNPLVIRVASFGYQRGFGGHFHNDGSIAAMRDVPGVVIACPSRGDDAAGMLRTCMALAQVDGRVVFFLEPIALYMTKDLHEARDGGWQFDYPAPGTAVPFSRGRLYADGEGGDLTIVSWGNGLWRSLRARKVLQDRHDLRVRVVDLRWLQPLDLELLSSEARATGRLLLVDEGRRTGGLSEGIVTALVDHLGSDVPAMARYCGEDCFVPLGPAWEQVLPSEEGIVREALELVGRS
jgi:2-oxoisovalerate dehydrogenase E1 component